MRIVVRGATLSFGLTCLVAFATVCEAQTRLSLEQAVDVALRSRALLKAEGERVAEAEGRKAQAGLLPNPIVQVGFENLRRGQTFSRDVETLAYVTLPLAVTGKRQQQVAVADRAVVRTQAEVDLVRRQITQGVRRAYWAARGAQERRDLLQASLASFQQVIDYHTAQLRAGTIAEQDVLRVQLEGERLQIAARLAAIDANKARLDLLRELGDPTLTDVVLTEALDTMPPPLASPPIEDVLGRRGEMVVAAAAIDEATANARLQDVIARPDFSVSYGLKRTQLPDTVAGVNTSLAAVSVTLPLFDRNQGNRAAASAELRRQEQMRAEAELAVRADLQRAAQEYQLRRAEAIETLQPLRQHARDLATIAQRAYQQGGLDLLRLLDAERARLEAESVWVEGMVAFQQSVANLQAAQGVIR